MRFMQKKSHFNFKNIMSQYKKAIYCGNKIITYKYQKYKKI